RRHVVRRRLDAHQAFEIGEEQREVGHAATVPGAAWWRPHLARAARLWSTGWDGPSRRARRVPAGPPGGRHPRTGRAALRRTAPHPGTASRGGGDARRRVAHLVHVARAGPAHQRLARRPGRDRTRPTSGRSRDRAPPRTGSAVTTAGTGA